MHGVRATRLPPFATAMITVDDLLEERAEGVTVTCTDLTEEPRTLTVLPGSDPVPGLGGVETRLALVDVTAPGWAFRGGFLADQRRRLVYERHVAPNFPRMRVGLVPLERPRRVQGTVATLAQANNYGHWLLLALPLVDWYRRHLGSDPDHYYAGASVSELQLESLESLGVERTRVLTGPVAGDRHVAAITDRKFGYDTSFLRFADDRLLGPASAAGGVRVLVSRGDARHRRLLNEDELAAALAETYGVERVSTATLALHEEIELFNDAELVVGAHGAGLTNIAFAHENAALVEIAGDTYWDSLFAQIAAVRHQRYGLVRGPADRDRAAASTHDFSVDVGRVVGLVGAALEGRKS
jgi:hypothetical protein